MAGRDAQGAWAHGGAPAKPYLAGMRPSEFLMPTPAGLYCPLADIHVDPVRPVARALITHGHSDHARAGHGAVLATRETLAIMAVRYGEDFCGTRQEAVLGAARSTSAAST